MARGRPKSSTAMSGKERMKKLRAKHGTDRLIKEWMLPEREEPMPV